MLTIRINRRALITRCRMKRTQQNSIMTNFQKAGVVFWIRINGFWAPFVFPFPPDAARARQRRISRRDKVAFSRLGEAFN